MNNEAAAALDEYRNHVLMFVWFLPSKFSLIQGKANKQLAEQHRINAQVSWSLYQFKKNGKSS
jgi:hypothetical protein